MLICLDLIDGEPGYTHDDVQAPLVSTGVLECPHSIAVDVPERARGGVHTALASVAGGTLCGGRLVDQTLLHDGAVHGEPVWGCCRGGRGGGSADECFEDSVL